uniref:Uncharacterized protein n=1 Tax=Schistocephalus solidus TaxID=70667 RepID=A0A0V0JBK6_SCHSO
MLFRRKIAVCGNIAVQIGERLTQVQFVSSLPVFFRNPDSAQGKIASVVRCLLSTEKVIGCRLQRRCHRAKGTTWDRAQMSGTPASRKTDLTVSVLRIIGSFSEGRQVVIVLLNKE